MTNAQQPIGYEEAVRFVSREADCLDHRAYREWLDLWTDDGLYMIPIGDDTEDLADRLNYAYDDAAMRRMRVARLTSGESMSARDASNTLRSLSRFFLLDESTPATVVLRCAQQLVEYRKGKFRDYPANVTYTLRREAAGIRLAAKTVRLINSTDALAGMSFLL